MTPLRSEQTCPSVKQCFQQATYPQTNGKPSISKPTENHPSPTNREPLQSKTNQDNQKGLAQHCLWMEDGPAGRLRGAAATCLGAKAISTGPSAPPAWDLQAGGLMQKRCHSRKVLSDVSSGLTQGGGYLARCLPGVKSLHPHSSFWEASLPLARVLSCPSASPPVAS